MDKLTALRVFRRVADSGSFIAAANELSLSAAAISKNIRELEAELGIRLINRTTRRMHLTDAGANYLASIRAVLELLDTADDAATAGSGDPIGQLRVTAPMSIGIARIAPAIATFLALYPRVRVDLQLDDRQVDVIGGGFDVAIRGASSLRDSSLVARRISGMRRVICAAPSYLERRGTPDSPTALAEHTCLAYSLAAQPQLWKMKRRGATKTVKIAGPLTVNSSMAIVSAATEGLGLALVPAVLVEQQLQSGSLVRVLEDWECEPSALWALVPQHRQGSRAVRLLVEHLQRALR